MLHLTTRPGETRPHEITSPPYRPSRVPYRTARVSTVCVGNLRTMAVQRIPRWVQGQNSRNSHTDQDSDSPAAHHADTCIQDIKPAIAHGYGHAHSNGNVASSYVHSDAHSNSNVASGYVHSDAHSNAHSNGNVASGYVHNDAHSNGNVGSSNVHDDAHGNSVASSHVHTDKRG